MSSANCPETPRQKMIGMMYLVLTAMLALNVSADVLNTFVKVQYGLTSSIDNFQQNNADVYNEIEMAYNLNRKKMTPVKNKADKLRVAAKELVDYIEEEARSVGVTAFCAKPLFMSDLKAALLAANNIEKEEDKAASWTLENFSGKRVLLVDDVDLNREIAQTILEEAGFVVETAPDGTDAVTMVEQSEEGYYDAILMDVQMPTMDGYEATRTIRNMPRTDVKNMPIIAMTANAMDEDKEAALKNGMSDHIAKPLDIDRFIAVLKKFLG